MSNVPFEEEVLDSSLLSFNSSHQGQKADTTSEQEANQPIQNLPSEGQKDLKPKSPALKSSDAKDHQTEKDAEGRRGSSASKARSEAATVGPSGPADSAVFSFRGSSSVASEAGSGPLEAARARAARAEARLTNQERRMRRVVAAAKKKNERLEYFRSVADAEEIRSRALKLKVEKQETRIRRLEAEKFELEVKISEAAEVINAMEHAGEQRTDDTQNIFQIVLLDELCQLYAVTKKTFEMLGSI